MIDRYIDKKAVIALSLCGFFLFYKYIVQLFPSLIGNQLITAYGYNGVMLAIMASSYYYSYTFMQVIAGILIDRFAIRLLMFLAIISISLMVLVFTHTENFYYMCFSRILMGVGASFATALYMKCAAYFAGPKTFGLISSLLATVTMLGAACGGAPVALLFQQFGWQNVLNVIACFGVLIAFLVLYFQKIQVNQPHDSSGFLSINTIKQVIRKKENWLLLIYSGLTFSPLIILGGLWGTPYLMEKFHLDVTSASTLLSIMFIGHAIGSPIWALISIKLEEKKLLMYVANLLCLLTIVAIIYANFSYVTTLILFFVFGFSVGCFMLSFEFCREFNNFHVMGFAVAFINSGEGIVGSIVEPFIGYVLDCLKLGSSFSVENYQLAFLILPICFIVSSIALFFLPVNTNYNK